VQLQQEGNYNNRQGIDLFATKLQLKTGLPTHLHHEVNNIMRRITGAGTLLLGKNGEGRKEGGKKERRKNMTFLSKDRITPWQVIWVN